MMKYVNTIFIAQENFQAATRQICQIERYDITCFVVSKYIRITDYLLCLFLMEIVKIRICAKYLFINVIIQ